MKILRRFTAPIVALGIALSAVVAPSTAGAAEVTPSEVAGDAVPSTITEGPKYGDQKAPRWRSIINKYDGRVKEMWAYSAAMDRDVPLVVITPDKKSGPRPVIYLLNGGDGGEGAANWVMQTDAIDFYLDKNVNVVIPMSGKFSYYTDWVEENANLGGKQKWETFLVKELPGPIEKKLNTDGQRAISGMSMSATSSLLLPQHFPGFYDAAASFSGCAATSTVVPWEYLRITLNRGGATPEQMWGPRGGEYNLYNDALVNAEKLRGTDIYVSNASGLAGEWESATSPRFEGLNDGYLSAAMGETIITGGVIEAATNKCTHDLKAKMDGLEIPADWNLRPTGTHSWGWWQDDLRGSWTTFARSFGI
ncbi:alpha/beta hydrolase [Corynebacterium pacaense]|uniref:alpha/beta hydrolase n=1 Tax=Corynebacterium pacaense TaxID=1816684 RepID=UPI0009B95B53|nr:alpha/beta hydrolase family protein [Corynebacterium pacaense]